MASTPAQVLILHGALGDKTQFKNLIETSSSALDLQAINFNGHGEKILENGFHLVGFVQDVLDYLDENNISKIMLFGYSMGGYVALYFAQKHPERVEKIMTLGTKFDWSPESAAREIKQLDPEKIEEKVPAFAQILSKRHQQNDWKIVLKKTALLMADLSQRNFLRDLEQIDIPIRLCLGDRDTMVSLDETLSTYKKLQQASLLVLPNTPHPIEKVDLKRLHFELESFFA